MLHQIANDFQFDNLRSAPARARRGDIRVPHLRRFASRTGVCALRPRRANRKARSAWSGCCIAGSSAETTHWVRTVTTGRVKPGARAVQFRKRLLRADSRSRPGWGAADVEGLAGNLAGSPFGAQQRCAHLGAVAVSDDDAITRRESELTIAAAVRRALASCSANGSFLTRADERVAANRNQQSSSSCSTQRGSWQLTPRKPVRPLPMSAAPRSCMNCPSSVPA